MKIGIMGGTFDPIHLGHLIAADSAGEQAGLDQIWFMPSRVPPHKSRAPLATAEQRLRMVERAVRGNPAFIADDLELRTAGKSYTVNTVAQLRKLYPDHRFHLIIGGDMVKFLPQWFKIEEISRSVSFIGLHRPGTTLAPDALPAWLAACVTMAPMPMVDISSTEIRERRKLGRSIRYLVPQPVWEFIEENRLYES